MFAVIKTGGKQYKVSRHDEITIEKLADTPGDAVRFGEVLMLGGGDAPQVGAPRIDGAEVVGEVLDQVKGEKVYSYKKRRRKHSSARLKGHRQQLTVVKITDILSGGQSILPAETAAPAPAEEPVAEEAVTEEVQTEAPVEAAAEAPAEAATPDAEATPDAKPDAEPKA